ncbi:hypothetical protein [Rubrivirga sp. IMCC43871]|uniref:hypothetical protein n=1 Tax=Rubrivirga sp. IMCC43871 TaxID=3391575 RepID=UPI00398FA533
MAQPLRHRSLSMAAAVAALAAVLAFGPRMDGPRMIDGVPYTTKTGAPGLTDLGWALVVVLPPLAYVGMALALRTWDRWRASR